ncbi:hypothetical protein QYE76_051451 [Lolium multiflorum]|uniref:Transposase (putative) gypsy type domain-containing protein n=1 Tax=Lolium multiflorum TaxID=4521 RepID=A0AAD8WHX3_LOLMU|nr:hypothetical protein QYE76_051451 [Lolium multiflorum]
MPPRARLTRHNTPESKMVTADLGSAEWERSKISAQDMNLLKKMGFNKKENSLRFPKEESYPRPPIEYRVSFVDHLIRGLSPPIHEFLRGLLFVYGLQLHQLTPNSILHMSIFITLCECFLGVQPNWALWKRIFCLRRNGSHNVAYNIGGVVICALTSNISTSNSPTLSKDHHVLASLPPLPKGGEVEDRTVVDDDNQGTSRPESEVAGSHKSATSSEKDADSEATALTHSLPPAVSPRNKRKRDDVEDSGTSKAEEAAPSNRKAAFDPYLDALVSSGDEEEAQAIDATARTIPGLTVGLHREAKLMGRSAYTRMEYTCKSYQLGHGGNLMFEKDLKQLVEYLGRPYPEFFGIPLNKPSGVQPWWEVTADLRGKLGAPIWETIWFSVTGNTWKEGLVRAMQEAIARLCGQNVNKLKNTRFIYYPINDPMVRPITMPPHPEMNHYVAFLDFMLYKTRKELDNAIAFRQAHYP